MRVREAYGADDAANASASEVVRHWHGVLAVPFVAALVHAGALALLWRPLPLLGTPAGTIGWAWRSHWKLTVYTLTGGRRWPEFSHRFLEHARPEEWTRLAVAGVVGFAFLVWGVSKVLEPRSRVRHIEGPQLRVGSDAVREARRMAKRLLGKAQPFLHLHPMLPLPKTVWTRHLLISGSVGSGKTQILLPIVDQLIEQRARAFLYDVKGDYTAFFPDAMLISPWDDRSRVWDIGTDVSTPPMAAAFASSMIPIAPGENPHWALTSRQVLTGILLALQAKRGTSWGWSTLARMLALDTPSLQKIMAEYYPPAALHMDPDSASTAGVRTTLAAQTRVIDDLARAWGNGSGRKRVSLAAWASDGYRGRPALIVQGGSDRELTSAYIGAMVNCLTALIVSPAMPDDEHGRTLAFVLDEFTSLGKLDIGPLIDKGRSKGVCCVLGFQDIGQIRSVYGHDFAQSLTSMVGTQVVCQIQLGETREWTASMLGKRRVATTTHSSSAAGRAVQQHEENRAVVAPSELTDVLGVQRGRQWPSGFAVRALVVLGGSDPLVLDFPGKKWTRRRLPFLAAPWTTEPAKAVASVRTTGALTEPVPSVAPSEAPALPVPQARVPDALDELLARKGLRRPG